MNGRKNFKRETDKLLSYLKPPPKLTVAKWAESYRYIARGTSPESGKYRCDRLPYQKEPMEALTDPTCGGVSLMWGAQLGKTEILLNAIGYFIDANPSPMLVVYPTIDSAKKFSTKKLAAMITETPVLARKVDDPKARDSSNTILSKDFAGGSMVIAGSNSPASLRQISVRVVIQDEIDTYELSAGTEGDPCFLADARASNFHDAVLLKASTPTIKGSSRIENAYEESDRRGWQVMCPECEHWQLMKWQHVRWPDKKPEEAYYECESCLAELSDHQRMKMVLGGKWVAEHPHRRNRGYHLSGLCRVMGKKRQFASYLHEFAVNFLDAKHHGVEHLKVWSNTFMAETWEEKGEKIDSALILGRAEKYKTDPLPEEVCVLTCAADVQKDRIETEVIGWGAAEETWGIEHRYFLGNPEQLNVWQELDEYLERRWKRKEGGSLGIACAVIDSGYLASTVYSFCRSRQARRVYAIKGSAVRGAPLIHKRSIRDRGRTMLFNVGTDTAKDTVFARLKMEEAGPRFMHFPVGYGYDDEFFRQLTAEEVRTKKSHGFPIRYYKKVRERNEALDLRVYNLAAFAILNPDIEKISQNMGTLKRPPIKKTKGKKGINVSGFTNSWRKYG